MTSIMEWLSIVLAQMIPVILIKLALNFKDTCIPKF